MTKVQKDICEKANIYLLKRDRDTTINSLKKEIKELTREIKELTRRTKEIKEDIDKLDQICHVMDIMELNKKKSDSVD